MSQGTANSELDPEFTAASPATAATPYELGTDGKLLTWVGATDAPGRPGDPTRISVSLATKNYTTDQGLSPPFISPMPDGFVPLLQAAEDVWEGLANIQFQTIPDTSANAQQAADIRVGVADLSKSLSPPTMGFIGYTRYRWTANNKLLPDTLVTIENPAEHGVTKLANGDYQYSGLQTTVFQDFLHELGHALGLAHNPNDPTSIMNPILSASNSLPDAADIAAIQGLYSPATPGRITLSQNEISTLNNLVPGLNLS